jgi:YqaJ-like viral recombinase domain
MPKLYWNLVQGSAEWFAVRSGIPTASEFGSILTPKRMELAEARHKYACRLIAERLLNWQAESLETVRHIEEGRENEPLAVAQLEFTTGLATRPIGFIATDDGRFGASPDRAADVAADLARIGTTIECKCPQIPTQMQYLLLGHGEAYRCQVQGQLYVAEADKAIFYSYQPRMPAYQVETGRDEPFIAKLRDALERFSDELAGYLERAKSLGMFQAFPSVMAPVDADMGPHHDNPEFVEKWLERNAGRLEG